MTAAEARDLSVAVHRDGAVQTVVERIHLRVEQEEVVGLVGETGAGKTLAAKAMLGLLPQGVRASGTVILGGASPIAAVSQRELRSRLGRQAGIVLQNPGGVFDPLFRLGDQLVEGVRKTKLMTAPTAWARAIHLLGHMGFPDPESIMRLYPHQLSGGMIQRASIAMALMPRPKLIVADEPTSALDAHVRVEALELLRDNARSEGAGVLLISHDLGLVSEFCDSVNVLYSGWLVESGATKAVLEDPQHPYTEDLLASSPSVNSPARTKLPAIGGAPPLASATIVGCRFSPRCRLAFDLCQDKVPALRGFGDRYAACHLAFETPEPREAEALPREGTER